MSQGNGSRPRYADPRKDTPAGNLLLQALAAQQPVRAAYLRDAAVKVARARGGDHLLVTVPLPKEAIGKKPEECQWLPLLVILPAPVSEEDRPRIVSPHTGQPVSNDD